MAKCQPGCTCGKHRSLKCEPGCECKRHSRVSVIDWDDLQARKAYNRQKAAEKYAADPEPGKAAARRWRERHPGYKGSVTAPEYHLKWSYGIRPERFAEMLAAQDGCCYLCGEPLDIEQKRSVHIDHDHSCCRGRQSCGTCVRGLTCGNCNTGIGLFGDSPERLRRVADNLEMATRSLRTQHTAQLGLWAESGAVTPAGEME